MLSKKKRISKIINDIHEFKFCGPSDDPDMQTAVCVGYHYLVTQLKRVAIPFIPESIGKSLNQIEVEMNNIFSVYEASTEIDALLPEIERIIQSLDESVFNKQNNAVEKEETLISIKEFIGLLEKDDLQLTKEFKETTAAISSDILQNPQKYKQAGKWLDQYYDDDLSWQKVLKSSERIINRYFPFPDSGKEGCRFLLPDEDDNSRRKIKQLLQAIAAVEFGKFLELSDVYLTEHEKEALERNFTKEQFVELSSKIFPRGRCEKCQKIIPLRYKLWLACETVLEIKEQCKFIGQEESVIVCLLTWLLANPDADKIALGITEFDKWEWYTLYESGVCSQRADVIKLLHTCKMLQDWQNLTCEAWQNIKNIDSEIERPTKKDVNPAFNDVGANLPAETKHGRLQQIIEVLKDWQKLAKKDKDPETVKSALPPIAETYDILCRLRGQCGAKTTNIISWLGSATQDGSGYYPALLNEFANPEVIADLEKWQKKPAEIKQVKKQLNESQKSLPPGDYLDEVSKQINEFIVGCPANKNKFCEHIEKVIKRAEEYGEYLRVKWQKAKEAKLTQYDEGKDEKKWFWWNAFSNDWNMGECVYFAGDEGSDVTFYIEGKPKPDPLCYLSSMIWGCIGQEYEGIERLDYQFVLLAIIHDAQNWQAGRERIYFNPSEKETLSDRLCQAVWHRLEGFHNSYEFKDVQDTINTALRAVIAELDAETEQKIEPVEAPKRDDFRDRNAIRLNFTIWNKDDNYTLLLNIINDSTRDGIPLENKRKMNTLKERLKKASKDYGDENYKKFADSLKYENGRIYTKIPPGMIIAEIKTKKQKK